MQKQSIPRDQSLSSAPEALLYLILSLSLFIVGCGRFGPPLAPEQFAAKQLSSVEVRADAQAINFNWRSPEQDNRGKELKSLDGYKIYRLLLNPELNGSEIDPSRLSDYELLGEVPDLSVKTRDELRAKARLEGRSVKAVNVDPSLKSFSFVDRAIEPGKVYAYRFVPFNQGSVESEVDKVLRIDFRGTNSQISVLTLSQLAYIEGLS